MRDTSRPHIALINDDTAFLELMHDLLTGFEGYQVAACKEASHAYELVKRHQPDLVTWASAWVARRSAGISWRT